MGIPYLKNLPWSRWSREERYFCAVLYLHASHDPADFAKWLIKETKLDLEDAGDWDVGCEVCFYRDYLWQLNGESARQRNLPAKRTFDLCLFGERSLIIVEVKVCEGFDTKQNQDFGCDKGYINSLDDLKDVKVCTVSLISSRYKPRADTLAVFDHHVYWSQIAQKYPKEPLFLQADRMYKQERGAELG
jgi:hypothetical protein